MPTKPVCAQAVERLLREALLAVVAQRVRDDDLVHPLAHGGPHRPLLVAEREVHSAVPFARSRSRPACAARSAARCSSYVAAAGAAAAAPWSRAPPPAARRAARPRGRGRRRRARPRVRRARRARSRRPPPRPPSARWRRSPAPGSSRPASTSGLVPPRSGTSPRLVSRIDSCASSASTRRSQASASWKPAPTAWPCTAAMLHDPLVAPPGERLLERRDGRVQRRRRPARPARPARARRRPRW